MIIDVIIVAIVLGFAAYGFRDGFISALLAFVGLALGLVASIPLATYVGQQIDDPGWKVAATVGTIAIIGNLGFVVGGVVGSRVRRRMKLRAAQGLDRALGGVLTAAVAAFLCWLLALPLATSQVPAIAAQVKQSVLLPAIDSVIPDQARSAYSAIEQTLQRQGLPDVLNPLDRTQAVDVAPPDPGVASSPGVAAAGPSIVKVLASSGRCERSASGSAFVVSDGHVLTNAHVVAGASAVELVTRSGTVPAAVVYLDDQTDLAMLYAPQLEQTPLQFASSELGPDADVVVAGYPYGGDYTLAAGRIATVGMVSGPNYRQDGTVTREVYALRASVVPGNSGGPLLTPDGTVAGVVFASAADNSEVGYALTVGQLAEALQYADATQPVSSGACYP
ncbi:MarP family serine protease [Epidermidibacterium keratini]|uniref:MarP family serine protease n=1 Tax=Epidermidibacterium keratini TaxID=1891644 RepID=A0A7L4YMS6_9ACTN|nr:MarP family serine protease [Epidermidibacterium keratini]QHC00119.1 MarP family serine protease [Epidermidibacterium keratini]